MKNSVELDNRISMVKHENKYSLVFSSRDVLLDNCDIVSYLSKKFIAVKIGNTVRVYKPSVEYCSVSDRFVLKIVAQMYCAPEENVQLNILMNETTYTVDKNAQISFSRCHST